MRCQPSLFVNREPMKYFSANKIFASLVRLLHRRGETARLHFFHQLLLSLEHHKQVSDPLYSACCWCLNLDHQESTI